MINKFSLSWKLNKYYHVILSIPNTPVRSAKRKWEIIPEDDHSIIRISTEFEFGDNETENQEFLEQANILLSSILQDLKQYIENNSERTP